MTKEEIEHYSHLNIRRLKAEIFLDNPDIDAKRKEKYHGEFKRIINEMNDMAKKHKLTEHQMTEGVKEDDFY